MLDPLINPLKQLDLNSLVCIYQDKILGISLLQIKTLTLLRATRITVMPLGYNTLSIIYNAHLHKKNKCTLHFEDLFPTAFYFPPVQCEQYWEYTPNMLQENDPKQSFCRS